MFSGIDIVGLSIAVVVFVAFVVIYAKKTGKRKLDY